MVGREIRYQLGGGRSYTATTDENGEVKFKLPTRDFRETQVLPLAVSLPERSLARRRTSSWRRKASRCAVSTVRNVYVAGESFDVEVKALDAEGKPIAQKLTLKVLEQTNVGGKVGEREVEQHEATTDKETARSARRSSSPRARRTSSAPRDRSLRERDHGPDAVQISDDEDTVRLRILADKHSYKVGDNAEVELHGAKSRPWRW